jgi:hypothetical protein
MGLHAGQEAVRILALSLDETRRGQTAVPGNRLTAGERTESMAPPQLVSPGEAPREQMPASAPGAPR